MKDKVFGVLQRVGRSFMLPIAILPVAGLLLGLGSSFTNETTLATYGLSSLMGPGTVPYFIFSVLNSCGSVIFDNLPLIFAIGVAIGMSRQEKEVAALAAAVSFLVMHSGISAMIKLTGGVDNLLEGSTASVLGITSLQMGAFGGIIVGLGVAALHNKFYKIQLPQVVSFFGGTRFVPIISTVVYALVGILMFFIWQPIQSGINALGYFVYSSGYFGTFLFGMIKRLLIPFGLHHVFYLPFWQTAVGGTMEVAGQMVSGAQNIFFAQLADPTVTHFSTAGTWCFTGEFVLYIFGFPGAALAMYRCAKPERKKQVGGLLLSAALTSIITGITEPLEFSFLFVAPVLFGISAVFAGLAYMLCHILNITVGLTFSGGFIDLALFGILQGNDKTSWLLIIPLGIVFFLAYYFIFTFLIKKFNFKTPGREEGDAETKLYTKADYNARKNGESSGDQVSPVIVRGLGGASNIKDVDCCATRLRVTVHDGSKVDQNALKSSGAAGVILKGQGVQVVYGPQVNLIKANLEDYLKSGAATDTPAVAAAEAKSDAPAEEKPHGALLRTIVVGSPLHGEAGPVSNCPDEAFAEKMMGDGAAIVPCDGVVTAPCDAKVGFIFDTRHAIGLELEEGIEMLIHVGINTVELKGEGFRALVQEGDQVKKGDPLLEFDLDAIRDKVPSMSTPVLFTTMEENQALRILKTGHVRPGEDLMALDIYES
ncbi:MAG TPA: glucose PTS transporter subunit IIA [Candidatus Flavonifractor merdigallinarum]|uniref:Glucose PTS transporter subunit IIA n=1 Tax=Candidatus Flavonifractor merdigallinarum TaxID=2838589 RepID=A0A9D1Y9W9_9FIRM|nr:glucose PTS transporter subunit IIA [Candidatus Flavonifractor merdigallinarum]